MRFKRPQVRYADTPQPATPYQSAAQVWDERIGSARVQAKNWRFMAFGCLTLAVLMAGGTYCVPAASALGLANPFQPDFARLAAALGEMRATSIITVPELLRGLMGVLSMMRQPLPSLSFVAVGGARVSPRLLAQAASLGLPVHEGYGLSEAGSVVSLNRPGAARPGTAVVLQA